MSTPLGSRLHPALRLLQKAALTKAGESAFDPATAHDKPEPSSLMKLLRRRRPHVPVRDETLTRPDGTTLRVRIHDPRLPGKRPVVVHAHGGGFHVGTVEEVDGHLGTLAHETGAVVISVDYRLLPDHAYPAALDDMLLALEWLVLHAERLRVLPSRMAFTGGSAGGNLVLATAFALPAHLPRPRLLLLCEPWLDLTPSGTNPPAEVADFYALFAASHAWCASAYAGELAADDPRVSPGLTEDLSSLPTTTILVGDLDLLVGSHLTFVERLRKAGVQATLHVFPGLIHGVHAFTRLAPARDYERAAVAHLRSELVVPFTGENP